MNEHPNKIVYTEKEKRIRKHWLISLFVFYSIFYICLMNTLLSKAVTFNFSKTFVFITLIKELIILIFIFGISYRFAYKKNGVVWIGFKMALLPLILFIYYLLPSVLNPIFFLTNLVFLISFSYFWINCFLLYKVNTARKKRRSLTVLRKYIFEGMAIFAASLFAGVVIFVLVIFSMSVVNLCKLRGQLCSSLAMSFKDVTFSPLRLVYLKEKSYDNLTINGTSKLDNILVEKKLISYGSLLVTDSIIGTMHSNGKTDLDKATIKGISSVYGPLNAQYSTLDQIIIYSKKMIFSDSTTKTITVKKVEESDEPVIELYNSKVDGDVIFQGGNGKVLLDSNSKVMGKVIGGVLERCKKAGFGNSFAKKRFWHP